MAKALEIIRRPIEEIPQWDDFVSNSAQGTVFQSRRFLKIIGSVFLRPSEAICILEKEQLLAAAVLLPKAKMGFRYATVPFYLPYSGIMFSSVSKYKHPAHQISSQNRLVEMILVKAAGDFHFLQWHNSPGFIDLRPFIWNDWHSLPQYSVVFQLSGHKLERDRIEKSQQRKFRQWDKKGCRFEEAIFSEILYPLFEQSYRKHAAHTPLGRDHLLKLADAILNNDLGKLYCLKQAEKILAALLVVEDQKKVYFLFSGRNFQAESSGAELYLIFHILQKYQQAGYEKADLLGAMIPGIAKSKLELGGELERSEKVTFYRNNLIKFVATRYLSYAGKKRKL